MWATKWLIAANLFGLLCAALSWMQFKLHTECSKFFSHCLLHQLHQMQQFIHRFAFSWLKAVEVMCACVLSTQRDSFTVYEQLEARFRIKYTTTCSLHRIKNVGELPFFPLHSEVVGNGNTLIKHTCRRFIFPWYKAAIKGLHVWM